MSYSCLWVLQDLDHQPYVPVEFRMLPRLRVRGIAAEGLVMV